MEQGDAHVRIKGKEGAFERLRLPASTNGKSLQRPRVDRIWAFVWPEPTAATRGPSNADAQSVGQANHSSAAIEHFNARAFEHTAKCYATQRSEVVVAKHRDNGQPRGGQELASQLRFEQAAILREVAGHQQQVGFVGKRRETGDSI